MTDTTLEPVSELDALRWLADRSPYRAGTYEKLGEQFGWQQTMAWKIVKGRWADKHGWVSTTNYPLVVTVHRDAIPDDVWEDTSRSEASENLAPQEAQEEGLHQGTEIAERPEDSSEIAYGRLAGYPAPGFDMTDAFRHASMAERILILIAAGLSGTAAYMSVTGMMVLFPNDPTVIAIFGSLIEAAKFFGFGVLAAGWRYYGFLSRWFASLLLVVAALINAAGVYGKLIENHVGPAASRSAAFTERDAGAGANVETAQAKLADLDKRISQIDGAIDEATRRGRSNNAMRLVDEQKRNRAALAAERERAQRDLANLRANRTTMTARNQADEAATMPVRYTAALFEDFGLIAKGTDPEKLIRWLSFMILISGDPLALALMVVINSRSKRRRA